MGIYAWQHPPRAPALARLSRRGTAPRAPALARLASWRARHWRQAVLTWFAAAIAVMAIAAEPAADFPRAQAHSVPAARVVLRTASILTAAGVPLLLIVLP